MALLGCEYYCAVLGMILPGCEYYCSVLRITLPGLNIIVLLWEWYFRVVSTIVLFWGKWLDCCKVKTCILIGPFSLYEVNRISLVSVFGSLHMTKEILFHKITIQQILSLNFTFERNIPQLWSLWGNYRVSRLLSTEYIWEKRMALS